MQSKSIRITLIAFISLLILVGCNDSTIHNAIIPKKFNKQQWDSVGDINSHPEREAMLADLIKHHQIKGLTYHQIIDSLGQPENYGDKKDSIYYDIVVNYGYLDPKSGEYLSIGFNKDSVATGFKVVQWKNRHVNEN